ncbi:hypothetical protein HYV89_01000 [Candidatus Woesearchaeota archaeon]|nr:hypothetical protein [Candidatus Woesearchaeota archaeon]
MIEVIENIIWLKDLNKSKVDIAGAKAAYLADLYNKNFPVANGFVISIEAFNEFLKSNNIDRDIKKLVDGLDAENHENITRAFEIIREKIFRYNISSVLSSEILEAYENLNVNEELLRVSSDVLNLIKRGRSNALAAVRSSSVFDVPGICNNYLNIIGGKNLLNAIKESWSSAYNPYNLVRLKKENINPSIAVLVQKMVDVNKSGVVLSSNPMNREREMVIEAGFGLGQTLTRGEITPDRHIIDGNLSIKNEIIGKKKLKLIRDLNTNETVRKKIVDEQQKKVLDKFEIGNIANMADKIEKIYNKPVIVEFGLGKKMEIFHVRLFNLPEIIDKDSLKGEVLIEGTGASPKINSGVVNQTVFVNDVADSRIIENLDNLKGVVVNEGSLGSCFAILCRQHGIPFVIAEDSTAILNSGLIVTVDGVNGKVYKGEAKQREEKEEVKIIDNTYGFEVLDL